MILRTILLLILCVSVSAPVFSAVQGVGSDSLNLGPVLRNSALFEIDLESIFDEGSLGDPGAATDLTELLQTVVDHASPVGHDGPGQAVADLGNDGTHIRVAVDTVN